MASPNSITSQNLNDSISPNLQGNDDAEPSDDLLDTVKALWLSLLDHLEATVGGLRLDIKLAASSLIALLVTGIVVAGLLMGLWFLAMALLFTGLVTLQIPTAVVLLVIVLLQLLLLLFCHRLSKRLLANLGFQATQAALSGTAGLQVRP